MPKFRPRLVVFVTLAIAAIALPQCLVARCVPNLIVESAIDMAPDNPFQAVRTTTRVPPRDRELALPSLFGPQVIARDSEGRVQIDRVSGLVHMQTGPDAGNDVEGHLITICDPVQGLAAQVDTANRIARVRQLVAFGLGQHESTQRDSTQPSAFCRIGSSRRNLTYAASPTNRVVEDLGRRTIEGFDTQGWHITTSARLSNSNSGATLLRIREVWCSEELGAVLLEVLSGSSTGPREEIALTKIERTEPDPSLFGIPEDYTVSEQQNPSLPRQSPQLPAPPQEPGPPMIMH
jgi:hypothetical protein